MKKQYLTLGTAMLLTASSMAFASTGDIDTGTSAGLMSLDASSLMAAPVPQTAQGIQAGQRFILQRQHTFTVIRNNVPVADQPNAVQAGGIITLPEGASLDILGTTTGPEGTVVNIAPFEVEADSQVPGDFEVSLSDFMSANAQMVNISLLDQQIEDQVRGLSKNQLLALDNDDSDEFFTAEARNGRSGGGRHGRGGRRHGGMTYCLSNVEIKAKQMGICPYKISEGYARRSLPGFQEKCHMHPVSPNGDLPIGTICVSHGTSHHLCGGKPCGDTKIRTGQGWYNGVGKGYSSSDAIGGLYGCVAP